jgi:hypothetical protein
VRVSAAGAGVVCASETRCAAGEEARRRIKKRQAARRALCKEGTIFIFTGLLIPLTKVSSGAKILRL